MIFVGRNHIFAVSNDGKAVVVGDDRVIGIDLERLAISLDREQGIHEPESFDLAGCRAPLAADQLLAEAGGMRMMIFELDDCGPSAMAFGLASAAGHGRSERRSISCDVRPHASCQPHHVVLPETNCTVLP